MGIFGRIKSWARGDHRASQVHRPRGPAWKKHRTNQWANAGMAVPPIPGHQPPGGGTSQPAAGPAPVHPATARPGPPGMNAMSPNERLWGMESRWNLMERAIGTLQGVVVPVMVHGISVSVVGGPHADLRRCWYLALAAAFGRYRRSPSKAAFSLQMKAQWDITGKAVGVTLVYGTNVDAGAVVGGASFVTSSPIAKGVGSLFGAGAAGAQAALSASGFAELIQRGPDQFTEGRTWPDQFLTPLQLVAKAGGGNAQYPTGTAGETYAVVSLPASHPRYRAFTGPNETEDVFREVAGGADDPSVAAPVLPYGRVSENASSPANASTSLTTERPPLLPDVGRVITTGAKLDPRVQPPRPPVDGLSRGSLVQLVTAALGEAGRWPKHPSPFGAVLGSTGIKVDGSGPAVPSAAAVGQAAESPDGLLLPNAAETVIPRVTEN
jgi:hypothetical protein